jgi:maleylacetoacetate isomerase
VPQVYNAHRWGVDLARFPRIARVSAALAGIAAVQAAHPDLARPAG